jgi:hypothetical protein
MIGAWSAKGAGRNNYSNGTRKTGGLHPVSGARATQPAATSKGDE